MSEFYINTYYYEHFPCNWIDLHWMRFGYDLGFILAQGCAAAATLSGHEGDVYTVVVVVLVVVMVVVVVMVLVVVMVVATDDVGTLLLISL